MGTKASATSLITTPNGVVKVEGLVFEDNTITLGAYFEPKSNLFPGGQILAMTKNEKGKPVIRLDGFSTDYKEPDLVMAFVSSLPIALGSALAIFSQLDRETR